MSITKHPVLIVLVILGIAVIFLGTVMSFVSIFFGSSSSGLGFYDKIGVIEISGEITDSSAVLQELIDYDKNDNIKAIILRINSPGGAVGASQEINREVARVGKPVIASMGDTAASGGYYIAAAADKIVANPGTITGSIGVIMSYTRIDELSKKIGISWEVIKSGEFKDTGSAYREMTDRDRELLNSLVQNIREQFIKAVAEGRKLPVEKVREIADGRIFSGETAKELRLVDELGNFQDAVTLAMKLAGIEGEPTLVYPKETTLNLWDYVLQGMSKTFLKSVSEKLQPSMQYRWDGSVTN